MKALVFTFLLALTLTPFMSFAQGCEDAGDSDGVKIIGYIQPQYEYQFLGDSVTKSLNGLDKPSSFFFNRARLGVTGNIPYDFSYYFLAEFSSTHGGPYILDAFVTYKRWAPYINIALGQFKQPFGLELQTACSGLYTIDRSRVVNELASPFRDMGLMVFGGTGDKKIFGLENKNVFKWQLAFTNGTGLNRMDDNLDKDFTGRLVFSPFEGFGIGGSYKYGRQASQLVGSADDSRRRWGAELSLKKWNFLLQGEYINGKDIGSSLVGGGCGSPGVPMFGNFDKSGYWGALMYTFDFGLAPILKYQYYNVSSDVTDPQTQTEFIIGLNYYFNDWTRFQLNYVMTTDDALPDESYYKKDYIVVQMQVKFN